MKLRKIVPAAGLMLVLCMLFLAGCGSGQEAQTDSGSSGYEEILTGTWKLDSTADMGWWAEMTFYKDGTVDLWGENDAADWAVVSGNLLVIEYNGYETGIDVFTISMEDEEHITLTGMNDSQATYEKQEERPLAIGGED